MQQRSYCFFLFVVGLMMLCLNLMDAPTLSDDMIYRFMWHADETAPVETIDTLGDLLTSQWAHYLSTNGRWAVHLVGQFFLVFVPPVVLQVVNTVLFVVLIHLSVRWIGADGERRLFAGVMVFFLLFAVFQGLRTTMLWSLGAFNYLWVLVALMGGAMWVLRPSPLSPMLQQCCSEQGRPGREGRTEGTEGTGRTAGRGEPAGAANGGGWRWLFSPLALFVGCGHEALSVPVSAALFVYLILNWRSRRARVLLPFALWFMLGTLTILLSPGVWNRTTEGVSLMSRLVSGTVNLVFNMRVTWLLVIALLVLFRRQRTLLTAHLRNNFYLYIALLVSVGIVFLCGTNLERVCFFTDFMAMLLLVQLLLQTVGPRWRKGLMTSACVVLAVLFVGAYIVRRDNLDRWQYAEQQMQQPGRELIATKHAGGLRCPLAGYLRNHYINPSIDYGFYCSYMGFDSHDINMRCAARLYNKPSMTFLPEEVVRNVEADSLAYRTCRLVDDHSLYVWRLGRDRDVRSVRFVLGPEDTSQLWPHQRLLAYRDDTFELDDFNFEVVRIGGRPYLVFTRPTTNIVRRLDHIEITYK